MGSKEKIDQLKELLYQAKIIYSWEDIGGSLKDKLVVWGVATFIGWLLPLFLICVESIPLWSNEFWFFTGCAIAGMLVVRYLFFPDKHRCYHLTPMGIHYTEQDMIPEVAYKIARGFAWVGIVVCIIVAFMLGPLAFVGAGAFALMSFGMTNFQSTVDKSYIFIDERSVAFNVMHDGVVSLSVPGKGGFEYVGDIYTPTLEKKAELLTHLISCFPEMDVVKIKRLNDKYKHPIYQQDEVAE
nr:hypothetical protein BEI47_05250 [Aliivibrio fischeri]